MNLDGAIDHLKKAISIDPNEEFGLSGLAMFLTLNEQFEEAEVIALNALDQNPHFFWNYFVMGQVYYYSGAFDKANSPIDEGLALFEQHIAFHQY